MSHTSKVCIFVQFVVLWLCVKNKTVYSVYQAKFYFIISLMQTPILENLTKLKHSGVRYEN